MTGPGSLMSVSLTEDAVRQRTKTVTRRLGWGYLKPGDRLQLCRKVMGRKPGEPLVKICDVEVVDVSVEQLDRITEREVTLEGLGHMTPAEFVEFFCASHKGCTPTSMVTRVQWRYLEQALFGPGHVEYCPESKDTDLGEHGTHCLHWWDAEPCCWCGTDEGDKGDIYDEATA